jgi:hypothetical protein
MTARTCATCVHSHSVQIMPEVNRLECRYGPPGTGGFPATQPDNWCGQHRDPLGAFTPAPVAPITTRPVPALSTRKGANS